jgi:hypothetical protein
LHEHGIAAYPEYVISALYQTSGTPKQSTLDREALSAEAIAKQHLAAGD